MKRKHKSFGYLSNLPPLFPNYSVDHKGKIVIFIQHGWIGNRLVETYYRLKGYLVSNTI